MEPQETTPTQSPNTQPTNVIAAIATSVAMIAIAIAIILNNGTKGESPSAAVADQQPAKTETPIPTDIVALRESDKNYARGDLDTAEVVIFEYSDSDCPFCSKFHPTLKQAVAESKGKVAWVYRFFPLEMHPNAHNEAYALACAGQLGGAKTFNAYIDKLIGITVTPDATSNQLFVDLATQQGLNAASFKSCMAAPATAALVNGDIAEAAQIGAQGTPYSIVMNKKTGKQVAIPGAYPIEEVRKMIDSVLK